jgi:endonuclease G, mitochondrial
VKKILAYLSIALTISSCISVYVPPNNTPRPTTPSVQTRPAANFPEGFDGASKSRYEGAIIKVSSGEWFLDNAVLGGAENDQKEGLKAVRLKDGGILRMNFDIQTGIQQVRLKYGVYQLDKESSLEVWASTNGGNTWQKVGTTIIASEKTLRSGLFNVNSTSPTRIEIRKVAGGDNRLNIDNLEIMTYSKESSTNPTPSPPNNGSSVATRDDALTLGNPSGAVSNTSNEDNFLMVKSTYMLSYNKNKNTANWVSWHLSAAWKGDAVRQNDFRPDPSLPQNWYEVTQRDYMDSGFDRGHLCPSDDRDATIEDNQETFFMTNMVPQAPDHNRGIWKNLEDYERTLLGQGNELYVIAGVLGKGGEGEKGFATTIGRNNNIVVPVSLWKIIVVLPIGENDVSRINTSTKVIAVNIPNKNAVGIDKWSFYTTTIKKLEALTGYDFLSNVPRDIQEVIER